MFLLVECLVIQSQSLVLPYIMKLIQLYVEITSYVNVSTFDEPSWHLLQLHFFQHRERCRLQDVGLVLESA